MVCMKYGQNWADQSKQNWPVEKKADCAAKRCIVDTYQQCGYAIHRFDKTESCSKDAFYVAMENEAEQGEDLAARVA